MKQLLLLLAVVAVALSLECYNGMKFISGSTMGESTTHCQDEKEYCYNISVRGLVIFDVVKGGCSFWRCLLAQDRCITTVFQNEPASFCCCSQNLCNVADQRGRSMGGFGSGGNNGGDSNFGEPIRPEIHRGSESSNAGSTGFNGEASQGGGQFMAGGGGAALDAGPQNMQRQSMRPARTRLDDDNSHESPSRRGGDEIIL